MIIEKPTDITALRKLWKQAFGDEDAFLDSFFAVGFSPERCRCVMADGQLAAAAYWFDVSQRDRKLAYIYAVATQVCFRGQGVCHKLMAHIHEELTRAGYDGTVLVPGNDGLFRLYESMGYRPFGAMEDHNAVASEKAVHLEKIDKSEFARLRREMLPAGGVVQEGAMLDFLATLVEFYRGESCLLCAACREGTAVIPELLGEEADLGGILAAMNVKQGTVRRGGGYEPFAMYLPLSPKGMEFPTYFALALD